MNNNATDLLFPNTGNANAFAFNANPERFDQSWRKISVLRESTAKECQSFIDAHYLHCAPAIVTLALKAMVSGVPVGCVIFALPPRETSTRYGGLTWELARLWLCDEVPKNAETWLIASAVKWVRKRFPEVVALVSYADPAAGHDGTIYKAANWIADGRMDEGRKPRPDYFDSDGRRYGRRSQCAGPVIVKPRASKLRFYLKLRA